MRDTSLDADTVVREAILRRAPIDRMRDALALSETVRNLGLDALRRAYPSESPIALVERMTGESLQPGMRHGPSKPR